MTPSERAPVVEHLRREQANAVALYLEYKGFHWNVVGPLFHDLHLLFDAQAKDVFETIDLLAERQRMLGFPAEYDLEGLRRHSTLSIEERVPETPREMVERLVEAHRAILRGLKHGFDTATVGGDVGSADLFTRCVVSHEKMEWFLRELLEHPAGVLDGFGAVEKEGRLEGVAQMGL